MSSEAIGLTTGWNEMHRKQQKKAKNEKIPSGHTC